MVTCPDCGEVKGKKTVIKRTVTVQPERTYDERDAVVCEKCNQEIIEK